MATRKTGKRGLDVAAVAGLGMAAGILATAAVRRHTPEYLHSRLECLEQQADTRRQANLASQQRQHWELLGKAMDDPELAAVLDIFEIPVTAQKRRQYLFANALYTNLLCYHRIGNLSRDEFFKHARGMFQNPIARGVRVRDSAAAREPHGNRGGGTRPADRRPAASARRGRHRRVVGGRGPTT
ncbi:DUF6082 family protein [Streptomyces sp. KMM 9044]|uniref:DUF6082 family protein n=1 Tax=Streptomyces sp. KMM 9044 TaxID=2744474 RepID=UPI002150E2EC|nr:DUF6082 family protein [Streptomyces sp. KMM 9044]WAX77574.1 DUF6082 family protein [Streptomyces sp. KMM 9044]